MRRIAAVALIAAMVPIGGMAAQQFPPGRGALVVAGGSETTPDIYQRFIELAGGPDTLILVVPTSGSADRYDESCDCLTWLRKAGARNLRILHTRDRAVANTESFVAPIRRAGGIWFAEGNSWRHADAYLDTRVHRELFAMLDRGGVIGGGSAGARIQGDHIPLRSPEPETRAIARSDWRRGFRLLPNVIVDVHVLARNRQFDLIGLVKAHPRMLGIGIDENTAIVVRGETFEVIGSSYVLIYDNKRQIPPDLPETLRTVGGPFYALRTGDVYNLRTRQATRTKPSPRPIERVVERPWNTGTR